MTIRFGCFTLVPDSRRLLCDGADRHLTPKAFDLLVLLVEAAPRVIPKAELHARLWPDSFVADTTLVGLVKELRRALADVDAGAPIIRTAPRVGYGFAADVDILDGTASSRAHWLVASGRSFPLRAGRNSIGRDPSSSVWLDSINVSRQHGVIEIMGSEARLEDAGSKNGTTVNGNPASRTVILQDGDQIVVGDISLTYRSPAAESTNTHVTGSANAEVSEI